MANVLRNLPSLNELLESPPLKSLVKRVNHSLVVSGARRILDDLRGQVQGVTGIQIPTPAELAERIAAWINSQSSPPLVPVINATGVILPPLLGRAPLAAEAIQAIGEIAAGYSNVEWDLASGRPVERAAAVQDLLSQLTGAEAALVASTPEAALLLTLAALAAGREVIVSRGQLSETSKGSRIHEIIEASGALLREAGTTNATSAGDYATAIGEHSAALLRSTSSNWQVVGFSEKTSLPDMVALARRHSLPVIDHLGSGAILDCSKYGIAGEPLAGESIAAGADLVLLAGDGLVGGPPCGLVLGKRELIHKIGRHSLAPALQANKLALAALAATLRLSTDPEAAERAIPVLSLLATPTENLRNRAQRLLPQLAATGVGSVEAIDEKTYLQGDALPSHELPTVWLAISPAGQTAEQLATALRRGRPAVATRLSDGRVVLDLRSVAPRYDVFLVEAVQAAVRPAAISPASGSADARSVPDRET
jgi:L-seryl-tRNA(Ser) seleniumtransferase